MTIDIPPMASPPTNTKIQSTPNTNTTHTHTIKRLTGPCHLKEQHKQEKEKARNFTENTILTKNKIPTENKNNPKNKITQCQSRRGPIIHATLTTQP